MKTVDYYNGSFTLNKNFILRKSNQQYAIFDITRQRKHRINFYLYSIFKIFQQNCTNLSDIENYFQQKNISVHLEDVYKYIEEDESLEELLVEAEVPSVSGDIYNKISIDKDQIHEFTPESIDFLITNRCNLSCPHCYRNSTAKDGLNRLNLERIYKLLDEMEALNVYCLKITGGEPFLCKDLFDIVSYATKKRIHLSVLTNATIQVNEDWLNVLSKNNISLAISLDGATPATHDVVRGKGSFMKTLKNLYKFTEHGVTHSIMFTVNNVNKGEVEDIISLIEQNFKVRELGFNFVEKHGRAKDDKDLFSLEKEEVCKIKEKIRNIVASSKIKISITDNNELAKTDDELSQVKAKGDRIYCKGGTELFAIDSKLNVYPCIFGIGGVKEYPIGNLEEESLMNIWNNNPRLDVFRGKMNINNLSKCSSCALKDKCKLKNCRLKPIYSGLKFTDPVSYCQGALAYS